MISFIRAQYVKNGIGRWAIIDKNTEDFIGWTGLKYEQNLRKEFNYYDLGYRLKKNIGEKVLQPKQQWHLLNTDLKH